VPQNTSEKLEKEGVAIVFMLERDASHRPYHAPYSAYYQRIKVCHNMRETDLIRASRVASSNLSIES